MTIVVSFPLAARLTCLRPKLQKKFGRPFVIDNKPGATGTIGATYMKRASPDGYTLLVTTLGPW